MIKGNGKCACEGESENSCSTCKMHSGCHMCGHGHGCWHHALRLVLGVVILLIVFGVGMKVGEIKGAMEGNESDYYQSFHHNRSFYSPMMYDNQDNLMYSGVVGRQIVPESVPTSNPVKIK